MTLHLITDYIKRKNISLGETAEDTINNVLEAFAKDPENKFHGEIKYELVSPAAVVLMGLARIKDPIKLYKNLADAFAKRGTCVFPRTVKSALIRLQNDAIDQGKLKEIEWQIARYSNQFIRSALSHRLSKDFLEYHLNLASQDVMTGAAYALVRHAETTKEEIELLLNHSNNLVADSAGRALLTSQCNYLTKQDYERFLQVANSGAKKHILQAILIRKKLTDKKQFLEYLKPSDYSTRSAVLDALRYRHDIPLREVQDFVRANKIDFPDYMLHRIHVRERLSPVFDSHSTPIRFISGKRPARVKRIQELMRPFRK